MPSTNAAEPAPKRVLTAEVQPDAVTVKAPDGGVVLRYERQRPADSKLPATVESGCYFHPVTTPAGIVVTDVAPADHLHHRGIFIGWVEMHGKKDADFWGWGEHAPVKGRQIVNRDVAPLVAGEGGSTGFEARNDWLADGEPLLAERMRAVVRTDGPANVIDLTYTLTPDADLTIARWAFSGFCVRVRGDAKLRAVGPDGPVELPNPSHVQPDSDWPAAPWYAYEMKLPDGKAVGVAVIDHPQNPPSPWHNHRDVRMLNPCIVAPAAVTIKAKQPLILRYRVVAFDGEVPTDLLQKLAEGWRAAR